MALATAACAHGGDDNGSGPGDDGGGGGQETSIAPPKPDGSPRDSTAPRDTSTGEAAGDDVGTGEDGGADSQAGEDGTLDSLPPGPDTGMDTGVDTGMDTGVDTGMDTGVPVHDAGNETTTNLPACVAAYAQGDCLSYVSGTEVSSNSHNWVCSGACSNCSDYSDCAPGKSGCPWAPVWTDKGECH